MKKAIKLSEQLLEEKLKVDTNEAWEKMRPKLLEALKWKNKKP